MGESAARERAARCRGLLHRHPPRRRPPAHRGPLQPGIRRRPGDRRSPAARSSGADRQRLAAQISDPAGRRLSLQRLLRKRPGVDGSGRAARHHHRPLRNLQRRVIRLQGGLRSLHHHSRRPRDRPPDGLLRAPAGDRKQPAHRPALPQSEARRGRAHPRGERGAGCRRWRARRAHGGVQPAQRRARGAPERLQAGHAEEHSGGQVPKHPGSPGGARAARRRRAAT